MKLTNEQLRAAALGAVRMPIEDGNLRFYRFSEAEDVFYVERDATLSRTFHDRVLCSAGVKLVFKTDSETLGLSAETVKRSSRTYFSFDVAVNGKYLDSLCNFTEDALPEAYAEAPFPLGSFEKEFLLGTGEKTVTVYFPWSVETKSFSLSLADGASFFPVKPKKRLLVYGDSITQGYDARYSARRYGTRLAEALDAEEINKAIGGEIFCPALAELSDEENIDYITVAYGTNDWASTDGENFLSDARAFYTALSGRYPDAKIFAITPIWRKNTEEAKAFGSFDSVKEKLSLAVQGLKNVTLIDGINLVPHDTALFADLRLHPRDEGFDYYVDNLIRKIEDNL